jgi:hypothetical protein
VSPTGVLFSYAIGAIFTAGGLLFLIALDDNRLLYGIPYLITGLVILGGVAASQRRMKRKQQGGGGRSPEPPSRSPY